MQETWVNLWVGKDRLEEEMATHSSTLARKIPPTEASWEATAHGAAESLARLSD